MEETLGKRIVANRKRLGITQDRLAEQLGVTAQAVSKWENDQSCPDIAMLPKLGEIFGVSVDSLLGIAAPVPEKVHAAELVEIQEENEDQSAKGLWEFRWDGGKKPQIWFAVWILLMGGMLLFNMQRPYIVISLWDMAWPSALMLFGLSGLYPKFSFFRLGCALLGGYALLEHMQITDLGLSGELLLIIALLLFGLSLLVDAIRKPQKGSFVINHNGKTINKSSTSCTYGENSFESTVSFGEDTHLITLPQLKNGIVNVSFGESTVDLSGCEELLPGCRMEANCSFGELTIRVPGRFRVELSSSTSFASVEVNGRPDTEPVGTIALEANASFGEISVDYI